VIGCRNRRILREAIPMVPDAQTNCVYVARMLRQQQPQLLQGLARVLNENGVALCFLEGVNQVWVRDFLPVQTGYGAFVRFRY
jgi:ubiquinone/menaquinone biosynthesis C-methylase UbiE